MTYRYPPTPERGVEVNLTTMLPQMVQCPFCDEWATAECPPEGGFWTVTKSCAHCRGIYSTGDWRTGSVVFKGAMTQVTVCHCGARMESREFTKHKKSAKVPGDHAIVEETWVDKI